MIIPFVKVVFYLLFPAPYSTSGGSRGGTRGARALPYFGKKSNSDNKIMKKRRRKKSRQGKRYSQINFVSILHLDFVSPCSKKKIRIRDFALFLAQYATSTNDSFTVAMLTGKEGGKTGKPNFSPFLDRHTVLPGELLYFIFYHIVNFQFNFNVGR